ncbi:G2/mitotic-specific cyclin-B3-like isoform X2 [Varroa jacobsoni]|nr:G2/mitotic-specific cyclin-B3-like isoform X2 [Varroa destructor]XP_022696647.1 G2/mitotic-specific cyclin-B3-like isoform X2 [Varroa jacobsoni]
MSTRKGQVVGNSRIEVYSENFAQADPQPNAKRRRINELIQDVSGKDISRLDFTKVQANKSRSTLRARLTVRNDTNVTTIECNRKSAKTFHEIEPSRIQATKSTEELVSAGDTQATADANQASIAKKSKEKKDLDVRKDLSRINPLDYYVEKSDLPPNVPDIDKELLSDPNYPAQYAHDLFAYLRRREKLFVGERYLSRQPEMTSNLRALFVDWLIQLQEVLGFNHETLYLSVKIFDRYLARSSKRIQRSEIQLLGAAAVLIASKMDERVALSPHDFVVLCNKKYDAQQFMKMETNILVTLNFELSMPLSYSFLRRFCRSVKMDMREMTLARFVLESSLMEISMITHCETHLAAAALLLAFEVLGREWNDTLTYYTGYQPHELVATRNEMNALVHYLQALYRIENATIKSIMSKYSHEVFFGVAQQKFPPVNQP